ncbi:hypothetical protein ASG35_13880 [Burkholderia sp. Leaf177]|nr:hypothetical protein ASG35_13880 [Burkholderia sp. Leaf177]
MPSIEVANALVIRIEDAAAIIAALMDFLDFNFILLLLPDMEDCSCAVRYSIAQTVQKREPSLFFEMNDVN